ncbi:glycine cleavage system protein GcvH [bacterium]|nr:MAG: glycine cleavage system protein GcvH [bacterium]RKZ18462.1 MAG: glycine cleavage system protein GcvH [bacterium]
MRPTDRNYTREHEWVLQEGDEIVVGITDHAASELGDIVYLDLPDTGSELTAGESMGSIETVKAVEELFAPVSGEVVAVNEDLADSPEIVNSSPYEDGWFLRIKSPGGGTDVVELLNAEEYDEMVAGG